ncbi:MAG TPA: UDP-glucose/GDP-mannose dehydrogenase family protein [Polyangiaceae bacterium LLY-WYZ-15_(1-7)]|nr:UDP-glucose 6-dehydrogenase [Sandaracinus sp.]HJK93015.1 UDP-glucose/GDP-mannose dehydrogenase family protein [Polyangiaceae bacterium LLY-WYZ-15_(1-7)]MBJ75252.1 UDP-glucose 6-dehydrogenase [Sandaracinus sp.]HJL06142.1 UDP-glucose/GDP-mannose dehydrogenase family protein [Polyangiaceae bacterium LLY-WYZ-15_(1-7)]HJL11809.1 UDP-glucose/GDP-mannose dehydrogenase family protein [Polyangiaceae bacterium LLY-WYZ-15_(1-7)]
MKLCMVGTGYVGLVSGACFAETGQTVICADKHEEKIHVLEEGGIPIFERGLEELVQRNVEEGRLSFTSDVKEAIRQATIIFVAVGTPPRGDGGADLSAVDAVAQMVAENVEREAIIVLKSTVPVGTNARVRRLVQNAPHRVHVVSNPEFLKEGDAVQDFLRPDRVVVGLDEDDHFARDLMARIYHPVCLDKNRVVFMDPASAELTKYVSNTMLAMRISFMNEIAMLCEKVGADVHAVRHGVGSDGRIGPKFLYAGPGYGGSCFPKDVKALVHTGREHGLELELAATTDRVNDRQKGVLFRKLKAHFDDDLRGKRIAVWGVAFKPRTDDIRESASLTLMDALLADGATIVAHDPEAEENAKQRYGDRVSFVEDAYDAAKDADALCLMTEWRQYQNPDFDRLKELMRRPLIVDGRNIWSTYGLRAQGFIYDGIGVRGN